MRISKLIKDEKTLSQITKLLWTLIICIGLLFVVEIIFLIPQVSLLFSTDALSDNMSNNKVVWLILWLLMFAQVTIIPVPAMPIYVFCNRTTLVASGSELSDLFSLQTGYFILFVTSACLAGAIVAYLLGKLFGRKAVKWIAGDEEEFNQWSTALNKKTGKYIYAGTIVFPIFPDDLLCLVAGAVKLDFRFFLLVNIVGRLIGCICMLVFLRVPYISSFFHGTESGGVPWVLIVYGTLLLLSVFVLILWKSIRKKNS